jgi:hypothetical protein
MWRRRRHFDRFRRLVKAPRNSGAKGAADDRSIARGHSGFTGRRLIAG